MKIDYTGIYYSIKDSKPTGKAVHSVDSQALGTAIFLNGMCYHRGAAYDCSNVRVFMPMFHHDAFPFKEDGQDEIKEVWLSGNTINKPHSVPKKKVVAAGLALDSLIKQGSSKTCTRDNQPRIQLKYNTEGIVSVIVSK